MVELQEKIRHLAMDLSVKLPRKQMERLVQQVAESGKSEDENAIRHLLKKEKERHIRYLRRIAERDGYAPFILFNKQSYTAFVDYFGPWAIDFMLRHLKDPEHITASWAAQFCCAIDLLGLDVVENVDDKYRFVTESEAFLHHGKIDRKNFQEFLRSRVLGSQSDDVTTQ